MSSTTSSVTWTRCDVPKAILPSDPTNTTPSSEVTSNTPPDTHYTIYGPGELETYHHAKLRRSVRDAKLKVFYPGRWRHPSPRAAFRVSLFSSNAFELRSEEGRTTCQWSFRSNARILSSHLEWDRRGDTDDTGNTYEKDFVGDMAQDVPRELSVQTIRNERCYDYTLFLPFTSSPINCRPRIIVELDTRPKDDSAPKPKDDQTVSTDNDENESRLYPPPCISLQFPNSLEESANQLQLESWEWRYVNDNHEKEEMESEWCTIYQCWTSDYPFEKGGCDGLSPSFCRSSQKETSSANTTISAYAETTESFWVFPHQMTLCHVESLQPQAEIPLPEPTETDASCMECLYDFGKELLGKVKVTVTTIHDLVPLKCGISSVKLRVGETVAEAMNDDEDHFEQSTELCCLHFDCSRSCTSDVDCIQEKSLVFISAHLLAFRYARIIIDGFDKRTHQLLVECHSQRPRVPPMEGMFYFNTEKSSVAKQNCSDENLSLDDKIGRCSAYTLQLCMHHNFIVDGIKRDRLPWAGDLAVSIMANCYSFSDSESIRFTLAVLGRCGNDAMPRDDGGRENIDDEPQIAFMRESHVNGIVDFSLWYVISHWLYQRYFGDVAFLKQEWTVVTKRLSCLIKYCTEAKTGRLITNDDDWLFIDWSDNVKKTAALQILWWWALECGSLLVDTLILFADNNTSESIDFKDFHGLIQDAKSRLESCFVQDDIQLSYSRHAHIFGVLSGLNLRLVDNASSKDWWNPNPSDDQWRSLVKIRKLDQQSLDALLGDKLEQVGTPFMKHLECLAISRLGERSSALSKIRNYWGGMLRTGATTFYEAYAEKEMPDDVANFYSRPFARSLCHAWGSGPCALLPEMLLGLRPLADGWKLFLVDPLDECPENISASVRTKHGIIKVHLDPTMLRIFTPYGTTMVLMERRYGPGSHSFPRAKLLSTQTIHQWSKKYRGWFHHPTHIIPNNPLILGTPGFENIKMTDVPTVYQIPGDKKYYMSFVGFDGSCYQSFVAESSDLLSWTDIRFAMGCGEEGIDEGGVVLGAYLYECYDIQAPRVLKRVNGRFYSLYGAYSKKGGYEIDPGHQGLATSGDGLFWVREKNESILSIFGPGTVGTWEKDSIYQPFLLEHDGTYYNFYNAKQMPQWVEQIGLATSKNLREWTRHKDNPILCVETLCDSARSGGFDTQFCSDAKVFFDNELNHWVMFYFGVGKGGAHIMIAFSKDLLHWIRDTEPLYCAGDNPSGLDKSYAHKISILHSNDTWYMFYCAVGDAGRGIGLLTTPSH
eukprot:CCRYP_007166-RA/>CCRYP_007166-RA protein AED:0.00 eAED:0.00 QI:116/-1/1/1/-1/1/1/831/1277